MMMWVTWCNIDCDNRSFKFTQPVVVKTLKGEFEVPNHVTTNPGESGTTLVKAE